MSHSTDQIQTPEPLDADLEKMFSKFKADQSGAQELRDKGIFDYVNEFNTGVARFLGIFVDPFTEPQFVQKKMANIGMAFPPGEEGQDFTSRFIQDIGSSAVPFGGQLAAGARIAARGVNAISPLAVLSQRTFEKPLATAATEVASVATAVSGGIAADQLTDHNVWARAVGELIGGLAPGAVSSLFAGIGNKSGLVKNKLTRRKRATHRINTLAEKSSDDSLRELGSNPLELPPAEATGDFGIISLQKAAAAEDHKLARRVAEQEAQAFNRARELLLRRGNPQDARLFLNNLITSTVADVRKRMTKLQPKLTPREATIIVREQLASALKKARKAETALWNKHPNPRIDISPVQDAFVDILKKRTPESPPSIPKYAYEFIGDFVKDGRSIVFQPGRLGNRVKNLVEFRKRLLNDIEKESGKAGSDPDKIRILTKLQSAIVDALLASSKAGSAVRNAAEFSQRLNDKFTRGFVGQLLGHERTQDISFLPLDSLGRLVEIGGETSAAGVRQMLAASPRARRYIGETIKQVFFNQALDQEGNLVVNNALRFLARNKSLLDEFPNIQRDIADSAASQKLVDRLLGERQPLAVSPLRKRVAVSSLYLEAPIGEEIKRVMERSTNARAGMRELYNRLKVDKTALAGGRSAIKEYLLKISETGQLDANGNRVISGRALLNNLSKNAAAFKPFLPPSDVARIRKVGQELMKIEKANSVAAAKGGVISDTPNTLFELAARVSGAVGGARLLRGVQKVTGSGSLGGGPSFVLAGFGSEKARKVLKHLTNDTAHELIVRAMEDSDVLKTLLIDTSKAGEAVKRRIATDVASWLAVPLTTAAGQKPPPEENDLDRMLKQLKRDVSAGRLPPGVSER